MNNNILKMSDAASFALHAMIMIAQKKESPVSVKGISEILGVSSNHMSKVLQRLVKAGLLSSIKGYGGGFVLIKKPEDITFLNVYEAIDGKFVPSDCILNREKVCVDCIMGDFLHSINNQAMDYFSRTKLSDFMDKEFVNPKTRT